MIVTRENFEEVVLKLCEERELSLDTETTGLRMYHGDRMFSLIIANATTAYYFNFLAYAKVSSDWVLPKSYLTRMTSLFWDKSKTWFIQNAANFDLGILGVENITLEGTIHCTKAIGRVEYNDHQNYSLGPQLERIGDFKDDKVEAYITANKLWTEIKIPGKAQKVKLKHFDRVPFDIIVPYGEQDGLGTFKLGKYQITSIEEQDIYSPEGRSLKQVMENERRLQKTVFRMRHQGVLIDRDYCRRAIEFEQSRIARGESDFKGATGRAYSSSPKLFAEVFQSDAPRWSYTDKRNPSFDSDALKRFEHPGAMAVLSIRDAKSKSDFYQGFLYHADSNGRVHPNFNPEGAGHGRFSSSEPNFQNLTSSEDEAPTEEFVVRRAIIPSSGFIYIMPDYDQMEYRFMLENACRIVGRETDIVKLIKGGLDVHQATANVATQAGVEITRYAAKTSNFLTLYGGGNQKLADALGCSLEQARAIRTAIFNGAPEIRRYINHLMETAEKKGYITNWFGRRCHFKNRAYSYRAPNYHTSGGCADIVKIAMNQIDEYLLGKKSRMTMTVHDELPIEVHESEVSFVPQKIKEIMESVFTSEFMPLTTGMEWSSTSLADKTKGFPA